MLDYVDLDLSNLSSQIQRSLTEFVPQEYRRMLEGKLPPYAIDKAISTGISVLENGKPVGIALGSAIPGVRTATIYFIHAPQVAPLLEKIEKKLAQPLIDLRCFDDEEKADEVIAAAKEQGWAGPREVRVRYFYKIKDFHPPWLDTTQTLSKEFTIFPWSELTPEEESKLQKQAKSGRVPHAISPFNWPDEIENSNSFGLRYRNEVVGWILTHRINPDTIRYSALYIHEEYRKSGEIIKVLTKSIKAQKDGSIPNAIFETSRSVDPQWMEFIQERLVPYAVKITHEYQMWRDQGSISSLHHS